MIGFVEGRLVMKQPPHLVLEVNGVGYEIEAPLSVFYDLPETGHSLRLHTHLQVREDAHKLYGFSSLHQRDLFRTLLKVSGVGPRVGLAILSGLSTDHFERCVLEGDIAQLVRVPGIGRKTAERLLVEMRDRLKEIGGGTDAAPGAGGGGAEQDALGALLALGYKSAEASRAIRAVNGPGASSEQLIRGALAKLAKVSP